MRIMPRNIALPALWVLLTVAICVPASGLARAQGGAASESTLAEWTVLIFMNGDNNLESAAFLNFKQLAAIGSNDSVNVVVQFDRIGKYYYTNPNWTQTLRFRITKGMMPFPANALADIGEANMGDGKTLAEFVTWGRSKFPAKRTMLIIWDHGQGWRLFLRNMLKMQRALIKERTTPVKDDPVSLRGAAALWRDATGVASEKGQTAPFRSAPGATYRSVSRDETDVNDVLYNREVEDALKTALAGEKLDVIGYDSCLMSMVETAYSLRDIGHYFVASEETEPAWGWKYDDWLAALEANPTQDAPALAKMTVESYRAAYSGPTLNDPTTTLAAFDLAQIQNLASGISDLSNSLIVNVDAEIQAIKEARAATPIYSPGYLFYHVDLGQFLDQLASRTTDKDIKDRAKAVRKILSSGVIANYAGAERLGSFGSTGLAIYFPSSKQEYLDDPYAEGGYEKGNEFYPVEFVQRERWADFLHVFLSRTP